MEEVRDDGVYCAFMVSLITRPAPPVPRFNRANVKAHGRNEVASGLGSAGAERIEESVARGGVVFRLIIRNRRPARSPFDAPARGTAGQQAVP